MQKQKGFVKILLVIVAIIVVAGFVYTRMNLRTKKTPNNVVDDFPVSETGSVSSVSVADAKDEMADWKTYKNEKYEFEVKYPADWKIQEYKFKTGGDVVSVALDPLKTGSLEVDAPMGLITIELDGKNSYVIGYDDFETVKIGQGVVAKKSEEKTGDNAPNPWWDNKHSISYYVGDKTKIQYVSDLSDQYLKTFNQILSTFKFIK